ncbi:BOLA class I histocompatibility antigen, alpha chain BL3-7-like isoform X2 [Sebastes umbrosus]|uniref:BOLA class I histocompatibility antigen, alpha chain BL3-7-like isoform X2 n=1 Tax=Sebastes umbrosus TaxID=72105 RepID=UPI00189EDF44|nr:BOLA class I histocompatibility antigen, alpha chain BL3-7-like isoform X2 [Sebastes umbrosus]
MNKVTDDDPQYWERETEIFKDSQQTFKSNLEVVKQRFNQTGDVHIYQWMYGCEWDDETEEVKGYEQFGYDGEDFISLDLKTETWVAPKPQAVITKHKWDNNKAWIAQTKHYLTKICPEWLKKYVNYGRSVLLRTELPSVSLLQKTPSSPVSCHATGFYPDRATLFWRKDGEDLHEDVDLGEILPNHDGTFQMSADLKLSSVPPEDWTRYDCVFQLSGVKDDLVTRLDKAVIRTNRELPSVSLLQKTPSSPVSCHATGFYPDRATLFWRKDGEDLHEDVDLGEILPNHDGTFQMSADLKLSSAEDRTRYDCVFQLSGVEDLVTKLDKAVIRTNREKPTDMTVPIIAAVVVLALVLIAVIGVVIYKKKNAKRPPSPVNNAEVLEELNPGS